ncbi:MAG TPA: nucleoside 2-deoxyribosyltransferase domain-containing protein [Candidatus Paceibacterota bacterium]|nr:nucleoside 2-deoxyribosyltransferase domain-containing protein [Candidatus Paceibacterota bacterium]
MNEEQRLFNSVIKPITIYWAGPLFTQAERIWNRICAECLRSRGYRVILPQDRNLPLVNGKPDFDAIAKDCQEQAIEADVMVAVLDGPDSDSGTSLEVGLKIQDKGIVIGVRTDFRSSEDGQLNAMFRLVRKLIYFPSFSEAYEQFCAQIDEAIRDCIPTVH